MPRSLGNTIADSLDLSLSYADRMLTDVTPEIFARFASPGGQQVSSNHGAFVLGHLCLYGPRIVQQLGQTTTVQVPAEFEAVFSKDATCQDDPDGTIYPAMDAVVDCFRSGYQAASAALRTVPDDVLQQANPNEGRMAELFPTIGSMHTFYAGGHMMIHIGQMSAWRRMWKLSPA